MHATIKEQYRGWVIRIRCARICNMDSARGALYLSRAVAVLSDVMDAPWWTDARPQTSNMPNRPFDSARACAVELLAYIKEDIDALRRPLRLDYCTVKAHGPPMRSSPSSTSIHAA